MYRGNNIGGTPSPNNDINVSNKWLPNLLNGVKTRSLASSVSERWLNRLATIEDDFYGDIVQHYKASFPRAFRINAGDYPEHTSNWGVNVNVKQTQVNWDRVYGIDIDKTEITKIVSNEGELNDFTVNSIQEGINSANLEELMLITYGLENSLSDVTLLDRDNCWSELSAEVSSHLGYILNDSFVSSFDDVVVLVDYYTAAKIRSLPSLRYVDRATREMVLEKFVEVPMVPRVYRTKNEITVTQNMIDDNVLIENYSVGDTIPIGSLIVDTNNFSQNDYESVLLDKNGKEPNIIVYDKRNIFVGKRPTLFNWDNIEGDIDLNTQTFFRGMLYQHSLGRKMNVSFCDMFKVRAFRFD